MSRLLVLTLVLFVAYGCSSGVKREQLTQGSTSSAVAVEKISSVSVSLTTEAKAKAADNLKFNQEELLEHVKRALDANSILLPEPDESVSNMEVVVKDFRVRSNFSAVMWGFMAGSDSITGDIVLRNSSGSEIDRFEVSVAYALGGLAGGQDDTRMSWLYEKFAEETLKELMQRK